VGVERLLEIMARLRDPERGCPWDREQTWASIAPHTIEEAYEIADAVERGDATHVRDELGDLLFQVVFQSRIAEEQGLFRFDDVVDAISEKLERRHPHVFGDACIASAAEQTAAWERHKAEERKAKGGQGGVLDGVTLGLPALTRSAKLGQRAARVGFDWPDTAGVFDKIREELDELQQAVAGGDSTHVRDELGDLLFSVAQLARHLHVDPEGALRDAGGKFERRFRRMEARLAEQGRTAASTSAAELEALWAQAKQEIG
jgi:tetrapyrrole methylase family protein/MazG family protein/ATP diphosphatase